MSFLMELDVDRLTERQGRAVEQKCRERGAWPIAFIPARQERVWLLGRRDAPQRLWIPEELDGKHLLSDEADWDAPAWDMKPELLPPLAEALRVLGEELPQGFVFRATWGGSEVRHERVLAADELATLALGSQLNEFTRYRVPPRDTAADHPPAG